MSKLKTILSIYFLFVILSCEKRAAKETTKDGDFEIEFLFEKDGCKMYRFYDGRYVYWTNCEGKTNADYQTRSGKTTTQHRVEAITSLK